MRIVAILCFVLSAIMTIVALNNVVGGQNRPEAVEQLAGYVVGSFLPALGLLIGGLILWGKSKRTR